MDDATRYLNVVDVEATCWSEEPPRGMASEIIEVGLTVVDLEAGTRVAKHSILVRPQHSTVSKFCTELTSLTPAQVAKGIGFAEACKLLAVVHASGIRRWASWGDYDRKQFERQCQATNTPYPFGASHVNAKAVFTEAYGLRKRPGMATALEIAALPLEGRHHRGADDAWNIAALVLNLRSRGRWPG
ncbi:exonuclease domain-containing protein [Actinospica sp. MGRD01-02]|uniref:Exonuclease domain-containing protein n=1 Tax=Actinospica acidithermotolerans TaxID=2828514 RepID=A0A941E7P0_9ACTN|nr:3'-5' exonuclease [Actinospica acidithermotolerans]MBR7825458.1 exonuclease domain-containing protein [Actinospica acidithermotolerans]